MRRIASETDASHAKPRSTTLMDRVRLRGLDFILHTVRDEMLIPLRESFPEGLHRECSILLVSDPPQTLPIEQRHNTAIYGVANKIGGLVAQCLKVEIDVGR